MSGMPCEAGCDKESVNSATCFDRSKGVRSFDHLVPSAELSVDNLIRAQQSIAQLH